MNTNNIAILHNKFYNSQILVLNKVFIAALSIFIVFKSIFTYLNMEIYGYIASFLFLFINLLYFTLSFKLPSKSKIIILFFLIGILSLIISIVNDNILIGVVGFIGTYFYMTFWLISFSSINYTERKSFFYYYVNIMVVLASITAVFAIYQYFVDPTLFGVNPSQRYSDIELLGISITRRATSFIGSPQNLGIYFGLMIGCLTLINYKKMVKVILYLLFTVGGILSGSSAFVIFLLLFLFAYNYRRQDIKGIKGILMVIIPVIILLVVFHLQRIENIENTIWQAFYIFDSRFDEALGSTYSMNSLLVRDTFQHIFGNGIGLANRLVEVVTLENPPANWIGNESYLFMIFFELGLLGGVSFLMLYGVAIFYSYKDKTVYGRTLFAILLGLTSNLAATPSATGLTMSFIIWPFIIAPFYCLYLNHYRRVSPMKLWASERLETD